jgi:glycosyltransferase involved in cell wall biosynthesis
MGKAAKLTVTVVTLNEERNLPRCLGSVRELADEMLVVDSGSTDRTVRVAEALGARVLTNPWPGHKEQKQFAVDHASTSWILSLDADEWITPALREEIAVRLSGDPGPDSFAINRITKFLGRFMRHGWQPDWKVRLFHKGVARWGGVNPHDHIVRFDGGSGGRLANPFYHDSYQSLEQYLQRLDRYTAIAAGTPGAGPFRPASLVASPAGRFLKRYVLRLGFRDGLRGLVLAALEGGYGFVKHAKLWEKGLSGGEEDPGGPFPSLEDVLGRSEEPSRVLGGRVNPGRS